MSRLETTKTIQFAALGPPAASLSVSKLVVFALLVPGDSGPPAPKQGHVYVQIVRNT